MGEPFQVPCCPDCTAQVVDQVVDKDGVPLTDADLNRRKHTCAGCNALPSGRPTGPGPPAIRWPTTSSTG